MAVYFYQDHSLEISPLSSVIFVIQMASTMISLTSATPSASLSVQETLKVAIFPTLIATFYCFSLLGHQFS